MEKRAWSDDTRKRHLTDRVERAMLPRDESPLAAVDWDFSTIAAEELPYCAVYEYARTSERIKFQINTVLELLDALRNCTPKERASCPEGLNPLFTYLEKVYRNVKSLPNPRYSGLRHDSELPGIEGIFLLECGFDQPLFQDRAWKTIDGRAKKLREYFGGDPQNPRSLAKYAFVDAAPSDLQDKSGRLETTRSVPPVSFHVVRVAWDCPDSVIKDSFAGWLEGHKPKDRQVQEQRGTNKFKEHLNQLAAYRLLKHHSWEQAAEVVHEKRGESGGKTDLYADQAGWLNASDAAVLRMRAMENHELENNEYLLYFHEPSVEYFLEERVRMRIRRTAESVAFVGSDVLDLPALAGRLKAKPDGVSAYIADQLSSTTLRALANYGCSDSSDEPLRSSVVKDLNRLMETKVLYDEERFTGVGITLGLLKLLKKHVIDPDLSVRMEIASARLSGRAIPVCGLDSAHAEAMPAINRLLLEQVFKAEVARSPAARALLQSV
jgi:hypothetical protein